MKWYLWVCLFIDYLLYVRILKLFVWYFMSHFRDFEKPLWHHPSFVCYHAIRAEAEVIVLIRVFMNATWRWHFFFFVCTCQITTTQGSLWFSARMINLESSELKCVKKGILQDRWLYITNHLSPNEIVSKQQLELCNGCSSYLSHWRFNVESFRLWE